MQNSGGRPEVPGEAQRSVGGDPALAMDDLVDPTWRHTDGHRELVLGDVEPLDGVLQDLTGTDRIHSSVVVDELDIICTSVLPHEAHPPLVIRMLRWSGSITTRTQCVRKRRQVRLDDVPYDLDIDPEVLDEDVPEPSDLRPSNLGVFFGDRGRQVTRRLPNDLEIAFDGVFGHLHETEIAVERAKVSLALLDGLEDVRDAPSWVATHSAMASASASGATGSLSS